MNIVQFKNCLERSPVIASVPQESFNSALNSPCEIIFHLGASIQELPECIKKAHDLNKKIFFHIDLTDGLGKDKAGVEYLSSLGADGIISTRGQLIRFGNEAGLLTIQRFFAIDSKGVYSIDDFLGSAKPDLIEIMPGVIGKVIKHFSNAGIPVIAGGLIETKAEVTEALKNGAEGVSTRSPDLWYI